MTRAWSLPVWGGAWLGLWAWVLRDGFYRGQGVVTGDESMILWSIFVVFGFGISACISRNEADYSNGKKVLVWWPVTRGNFRHNRRARLLRRKAACEEKAERCEALAEQLSEGWGGDPLREPVLAAERADAKRRAEMLDGDVKRLEASWQHEDREREYRRLTS